MASKSQDDLVAAELKAMHELNALLTGLGLESRSRVLKWGKETLLDDPLREFTVEVRKQLSAHFEELGEQAKLLGVSPEKLTHAYSALRERQGLAPIEIREEFEKAGGKAKEKDA